MTMINTHVDFVASLTEAQRSYFLRHLAEVQRQLQDTVREISRGLSAVNAFNQSAIAVLAIDPSQRRKVLVAGNTEYRYSTVPGSGRIKVSFQDGREISMWEAGRKNPWVLPLEGFKSFMESGHAEELHRQLLIVDLRRRSA